MYMNWSMFKSNAEWWHIVLTWPLISYSILTQAKGGGAEKFSDLSSHIQFQFSDFFDHRPSNFFPPHSHDFEWNSPQIIFELFDISQMAQFDLFWLNKYIKDMCRDQALLVHQMLIIGYALNTSKGCKLIITTQYQYSDKWNHDQIDNALFNCTWTIFHNTDGVWQKH